MADFQRDIELLEEYKQWQVLNKGKGDTSPTAFMVAKAQEEAFSKLEKLETWADKANRNGTLTDKSFNDFTDILAGRV